MIQVCSTTLALHPCATQFGIVGIDGLLRSMWALIFSREETVREAVVDAVFNLYLRDPPGNKDKCTVDMQTYSRMQIRTCALLNKAQVA
jgi:hypothetical protein